MAPNAPSMTLLPHPSLLLLLLPFFLAPPTLVSADCLPTCPILPFDLCDFVFADHPLDVPALKIGGPINGDVPISAPIISYKTKGKPVEVDQSGPGKLECKPKWGAPWAGAVPSQIPGQEVLFSSGSQFYAVGEEAKVYSRTFQPSPGIDAFAGRCVLLPLLNIHVPKTESAPDVNLSPGDGNRDYPEERRCVVFKTWKA